jgi:hypothetical protein
LPPGSRKHASVNLPYARSLVAESERRKAGCTKIVHWRKAGGKHKGSLKKETIDVWKCYLEFFNEVLRLDSAEDPVVGQTREPRQGCSEYCLPVQLSYAQEGTNAEVKLTRDETVDTYAFSNPMPVPSGWFISGKSFDLSLSFLVISSGTEIYVRLRLPRIIRLK